MYVSKIFKMIRGNFYSRLSNRELFGTNINFLIVAWRGFSGNKGKPSEAGLYKDAQSAVEWLKSKEIIY